MNWKSGPFLSGGSADALTVDEGDSLASKASLATDFPVGNAAGPACADSVGTANGHAGTKPFAGAGDSVPFDWIGSGSSAALGRAGADVGIAGIVPLDERKRTTVAFYGPIRWSGGGDKQRYTSSPGAGGLFFTNH